MLVLRNIRVGSHDLFYRNELEFVKIYDEVYNSKEYYFDSTSDAPFIIDCGAHIGVSVLYFKQLYPNATILAFEPDERNVLILEQNIKRNCLNGVDVIPAAVWSQSGVAEIYYDQEMHEEREFTWGNTLIHNIWGDADVSAHGTSRTVRLSEYITRDVDFLKLDIEGSEETVMKEIADKLPQVKRILVEYHGTDTGQQSNNLQHVKDILEEARFCITVEPKSVDGLYTQQQIEMIHPTLATIRAKNRRWID